MAKKKEKTFAVTVINNETRVFRIEAKNAKEAQEKIETPDYKEVLEKYPSRVVHAEFFVDDVNDENAKEGEE
jgi:hypothetical protein